jgi:erythromycin esterase
MEGDGLVAATMGESGLEGSKDWTAGEVTLRVPKEAAWVRVGVSLTGDGTAWADDLAVEAGTPYEDPPLSTLGGKVEDKQGKPVAGVWVALASTGAFVAAQQTNEDGAFTFSATGSDYRVSALDPVLGRDAQSITQDAATKLVLRNEGAEMVRARFVWTGEPRPDLLRQVLVMPVDRTAGGDLFVVPLRNGELTAHLPPSGSGYQFDRVGGPLEIDEVTARAGRTALVKVRALPSMDAATMAALKESCVAVDKLPSLARRTKVIALGEATHGTHEIFAFKAEAIRLLVERGWAQTIAMEMGIAEASNLDAYVQSRTPSAEMALKEAGPVYNTEELLALLGWLRDWNAAHPEGARVQIVGFDMQDAKAPVAELGRMMSREMSLDAKSVQEVRTQLLARRGPERARGLFLLGLIEQYLESEAAGAEAWRVRERGMATNILALLDMRKTRGGMIVWGHNAHLQLRQGKLLTAGSFLRRTLRDGYLAVGTAVGDGSVQAVDPARPAGMRAIALPAMSDWDVSAFMRGARDNCLLDLRKPLPPAAARWVRDVDWGGRRRPGGPTRAVRHPRVFTDQHAR